MRQALLPALLLTLALGACTPNGEGVVTDDVPTVTTITAGRLTACVTTSPVLAEEIEGDVAGFDVAVLAAVADVLQLSLDVVETTLDDVVAGVALNSGSCDIAAGGVVDRAALDGIVLRSAPYRTVHRQLLGLDPGPAVAPDEITARVGYEDGGAAAAMVADLVAAEAMAFPSRADLGRALQEHVVDLVLVTLTDRVAIEEQLRRDLVLRGTVPTDESTVLLLPLAASDDLVAGVDEALEALRVDGTLAGLVDAWLRG